MNKYTPAPWHYTTTPQPNGCPIIGNERGLMVAMLAHSVNHHDQREEAEANARLIAAAPELLEVVEMAAGISLHTIPNSECKCSQCEMVKAARAAIFKATGEKV